ncbi:serine hydrolase domain-containing protein [Scatolibacter rhodanostii]|uniref:serine hydrolase domain-containing protein n=1 Tax=Scatolibacter rhodanostii TaxID=2014781 RepID=UPI00190E5F27|nr:serine hydrolase domain-containing protein [Scatolibacter rhodanostii]
MNTEKQHSKMNKKARKKKVLIAFFAFVGVVGILILGLSLYGKYQLSKVPALSFEKALEYTTKNNDDAVITVGIIRDGHISYTVYGENGKELPQKLHTYEIGSLTKTFTAALINMAISEGKIDIDSTIDTYLPLSDRNEYPTIRELLTHTSGYKGYYFEYPMISNFFGGRNDFFGITKEMVLNKLSDLSMDKESYGFTYSNFGYAVLGLLLEAVYDADYTTLVNEFAVSKLGLTSTKISDKSGNLGNYWDWKDNDAYLSAGAITSNISDMLFYTQMQLEENSYFAECHNSLETINATTEDYKAMDIRMDEIGMSWIIDSENGIIWHNGGTGNYNSYLGFNPETGTAVVILSNLSPNYRIPATVLGAKLLMELEN